MRQDGTVLWFNPLTMGSTNLQMQTYKGAPVLTWWQGDVVNPGYGIGEYQILDSSYQQVATVQAGNGLKGDLHEFIISPQNTALFTIYEQRPEDLSSVGGPSDGQLLDSLFQEVDIATGKVLMHWRASHHVALSESYLTVPQSKNKPYDFFHINSIDIDDDGNLLVSSRHTWCIYKIDRSSGEIIWRLNGKKSDFHMGWRTHFHWQHDARHRHSNVVTLFDDGAGPTNAEPTSRGLKLYLNTKKMRAELIEAYTPHPKMLAHYTGSTRVLSNGNVFIGWGNEPYFSEYSANGHLLYQARFPDGVYSYRAIKAPWRFEP